MSRFYLLPTLILLTNHGGSTLRLFVDCSPYPYVPEGEDWRCTCGSGQVPGCTASWSGERARSEGAVLEIPHVRRKDNGTEYTCQVACGSQRSRAVAALQVAYGPDSVTVQGPDPYFPNGTLTLVCVATGVNPQPSAYHWEFPARFGSCGPERNTCSFTPTDTIGLRIKCSALNSGNNAFVSSPVFTVDPRYVNECNLPGLCGNGGTCVDTSVSYLCACPVGTSGKHCSTDSVNECGSDPCRNGGTCADLRGQFACSCVAGTTGPTCEHDSLNECASEPCANGGTCSDLAGRYLCECPPGFTGINCAIEVHPCGNKPCLNGGSCTSQSRAYTCQCLAGYTGRNCEIAKKNTGDSSSSNAVPVAAAAIGAAGLVGVVGVGVAYARFRRRLLTARGQEASDEMGNLQHGDPRRLSAVSASSGQSLSQSSTYSHSQSPSQSQTLPRSPSQSLSSSQSKS